MKYTILSLVAGALISCSAMAENTLTVKMNDALSSGTGENIGEITVSETPYGLLFTPHLNGLTPKFTASMSTQNQVVCRE